MNSKYIPTFPQALRISRFLFSLIIASVLGSLFKSDNIWIKAGVHSSQFMMFTAVATMLYDLYAFFSAVDKKAHDCTVSKKYKIGHSIAEGVVTLFWWAALAGLVTALETWIQIELHGGLGRREQNKNSTHDWGKGKVVGSLSLAGIVGAISTILWINLCYQASRI